MKNVHRKYVLFGTILFIHYTVLKAQDTYVRNTSADVQAYIFSLSLNDDNNKIKGESRDYRKF